MVTKNQLRVYAGLHVRKARTESGLFMVEGHKVVLEGLKSSCRCEAIFIRKGFAARDAETEHLLLSHPNVNYLDSPEFDKLTRTDNPQGVLGVFDYRPLLVLSVSSDRLVALYDLADPRNVGTIIRTSDWFGIKELIIGENCADIFNEKVVRSTVGSIFHCRFLLADNLLDELRKLKPAHQILTADLNGTDYRQYPRQAKSVLVFSNEARGPSEEILSITDTVLTIPGGGQAESLNVASAAAILIAGQH